MKLRKNVPLKTTFLSLLACAGAALVLRADPVIQFDDLSPALTQVPDSYHVLGWNNLYLMNGSTYSNNPSGFGQGIVSSNNVIYGGGGSTASITAQMFDFVSAYVTAAFNDNLKLEARGYINGTLVYDTTNILSATSPTLIQFGFYGVDEVDLTSSGGSHHLGYPGSGTQFVMDNVSVKTWLPYAPLLVNGDFETGDLTGWNHTGNLGGTGVTSTPKYVHSGSYGLQIGPLGSPGYLSQTIHTQPGHNYDLDFFLENEAPGANSWEVTYANGVDIDGPEINSPAFGWIHFLTGFHAAQSTETVTFQFENDPDYFGLDDISITDKSQQISNGGFESGDFTWWSVWGNTNDITVGPQGRLGTHGALIGPPGFPGYLSPSISVSPGQPYLLSLWLSNPSGSAPTEYHVSWTTALPGGPVVTQSLADQTNLPAFGWTNLHYTVVGDTFQNSGLTFGFRNDPSWFFLDEVSMWPVPLIQNGSFEFGDFSGWTTNGNFNNTAVSMPAFYANDGFYGARLGPVGSLGFISQTIPTAPGQSYVIYFEFHNNQPMTNTEFKVSWNSTVLMDLTNDNTIGWETNQFVIAATGTNATLQFGFRDDPSYLGLDNVSVTPVQQPYIESISKNNSSANLRLNAVPEYLYQLQYTTNLSHPNWIDIGSPASPTGYPWYVTDPNATDNQRFYRMMMEQSQ